MTSERGAVASRRARAFVLLTRLAVGGLAAAAPAQEPESRSTASNDAEAASASRAAPDLARLIARANDANPYVSAQATKALERHGAAIFEPLFEFVERRSIYALSAPMIERLGALKDRRAKDLLRRCAFDREFPWRPHATRALTALGSIDARADLVVLLGDALAPVREAAASGLGAFDPTSATGEAAVERERLVAALADPSFDVRAAAAETLFRRGDRAGLPTMLDGLDLSRRFFDLDFGAVARERAWRLVQKATGTSVPFEPFAPSALRKRWIGEIAAEASIDVAPPSDARRSWAPDADDVLFGLEVRSCRRGDAFVRVTPEGEIVVGDYDLRRGKLAPEAFAALRAAAETARRVPSAPLYGRGGCDFERYYLPDEDGLIKITVGPEGRPSGVLPLSRLLLEAIGDAFGAEAHATHLERVAQFARFEEEDDEE